MASQNAPNVAAVLEKKGERLHVTSRPIPTPGSHELLIRNHAIAGNPADWKMQDYGVFIQSYPTILGSDVCGIITQVGSSVTKFKVGDRVAGDAAVLYSGKIDDGAFQTYTLVKEIATARIPDSMTFEEGAVLPMAFNTAALALFVELEIPRPGGERLKENAGLLVWSAASSVGSAAVQLAKNAGLKIFATASPKHHDYVKSLGATEVFDYRDPDIVGKLTAAAKNANVSLSAGFDTITEGSTTKTAADVLLASGGKGSKLTTVGEVSKDHPVPQGVDVSMTLAFKSFTEHADLGAWFFKEWLPEALEQKKIVPSPKIEVVKGGIGATQELFDRLKAGVSGKKLVIKVD